MDRIGPDRQMFLLCDRWYPKGCVAGLVEEYHNPDIICNTRIDTVMYDLPPACTGKRGRPGKYGRRLSPEDYRVRSHEGIERLVNLECMAYSAVTLLPYSDETFSCYKSASVQETRFGIGQQIQAGIIFSGFVEKLETVKKSCALIKMVEYYILSGFNNIQKL